MMAAKISPARRAAFMAALAHGQSDAGGGTGRGIALTGLPAPACSAVGLSSNFRGSRIVATLKTGA